MAKRSPLNVNTKLFEYLNDSQGKPVQQGPLTREFIMFLNQFLVQAETQDDAAADPPTDTEFNALIDKLQAAGLME